MKSLNSHALSCVDGLRPGAPRGPLCILKLCPTDVQTPPSPREARYVTVCQFDEERGEAPHTRLTAFSGESGASRPAMALTDKNHREAGDAGIEGDALSDPTLREADTCRTEPLQMPNAAKARDRDSVGLRCALPTVSGQNQDASAGAFCGACVARLENDPELMLVVNAWPELPTRVKRELLAAVGNLANGKHDG